MTDVRDRDRDEHHLDVSDTPSYQEEGPGSCCYICHNLTQVHLPSPHRRHNLVAVAQKILMKHLAKDWNMMGAVMTQSKDKSLNVVSLNV